jgi:hypothetical protein
MRLTFDDYNETCDMINGSAAIHPHNLPLLMLRGISSNGQFGQTKPCVINAFDTTYMLSADNVMASILYLAQNMEEELLPIDQIIKLCPTPPISMFVVAGRGQHGGHGEGGRGGCVGRVLPNKYSACGGLDHIMSSCTASDDTLMK